MIGLRFYLGFFAFLVAFSLFLWGLGWLTGALHPILTNLPAFALILLVAFTWSALGPSRSAFKVFASGIILFVLIIVLLGTALKIESTVLLGIACLFLLLSSIAPIPWCIWMVRHLGTQIREWLQQPRIKVFYYATSMPRAGYAVELSDKKLVLIALPKHASLFAQAFILLHELIEIRLRRRIKRVPILEPFVNLNAVLAMVLYFHLYLPYFLAPLALYTLIRRMWDIPLLIVKMDARMEPAALPGFLAPSSAFLLAAFVAWIAFTANVPFFYSYLPRSNNKQYNPYTSIGHFRLNGL